MKKYHYSIILMFTLLISQNANAGIKDKEYTHGFVAFPPYWLSEPEGDTHGIGYDAAKLMYENAGLKVKFVETPYARILSTVQSGQLAFAHWGGSAGKGEIVSFPIDGLDLRFMLYARPGTEFMPKTLEEFVDQSVIAVRLWPLMQLEPLRQQQTTKLRYANSVDAAIKMLLLKRSDYLLSFADPIEKLGPEVVSSMKGELIGAMRAYSIIVSLKHPDHKELHDAIHKSFTDLVERGKIDPVTLGVAK